MKNSKNLFVVGTTMFLTLASFTACNKLDKEAQPGTPSTESSSLELHTSEQADIQQKDTQVIFDELKKTGFKASEKVKFTAITPEDEKILAKYLTDPKVTEHLDPFFIPPEGYSTPEEALKYYYDYQLNTEWLSKQWENAEYKKSLEGFTNKTFKTKDEMLTFLQGIVDVRKANKKDIRLTIRLNDKEETPIGEISYHDNDGVLDLYCWLAPQYQGKGYGSETVKLSKYIFDNSKVEKFILIGSTKNEIGLKLAEKSLLFIRGEKTKEEMPILKSTHNDSWILILCKNSQIADSVTTNMTDYTNIE